MQRRYVDCEVIEECLERLGTACTRPGRLYLVGEAIQVYEGWRKWTARLDLAGEVALEDQPAWDTAVQALSAQMGIEVVEESPANVIPVPDGHAERARLAGGFGPLQLYYFDPYSIAFRLIARGDEADYAAILRFLQHGWLAVGEMETLLAGLLPQFTNDAIEQDPAEFRRKFRGLLQMWRANQRAAR